MVLIDTFVNSGSQLNPLYDDSTSVTRFYILEHRPRFLAEKLEDLEIVVPSSESPKLLDRVLGCIMLDHFLCLRHVKFPFECISNVPHIV